MAAGGIPTMNTGASTSGKKSLSRLVSYPTKPKPFRVMVLGQSGVGKTALVVRFITKKYIGEYDRSTEKIYSSHTTIDKEEVWFEILDSGAETQELTYANIERNIRWAEAFILMYSVTDKCSFEELHRLKFLINYNKKKRRFNTYLRDNRRETPVVMVGNKSDVGGDRMVSTEEGQRRSKEIGCVCFHEISVRENIDQVLNVFNDLWRFWRIGNRCSRWSEDRHPSALHFQRLYSPLSSELLRRYTEEKLNEEDETEVSRSDSPASCYSDSEQQFRARANTDSRLPPHPTRAQNPVTLPFPQPARRMSVSMKGSNSGTR